MSARLSLIAVLVAGCRGDEATKPPASSSRATTSPVAPRPTLPDHTARTPEERQALEHALAGPEQTFLAETIDHAWAKTAHDAIKAGAPWAGVECRTQQCRISFIALDADDAMAKTDTLRALRNPTLDTELAQWMPVPPVPRPDGTLEVRLYAQFSRTEAEAGPKRSSDDSSKSSL